MTITIIGLITILGVVLGTAYKLYTMVHGIELHITNHFEHKLERIEDKVDKVEEAVYRLSGKINGSK